MADLLNLDISNNGFINLLHTLEDGELIAELDNEIQEQVQLVKMRQGKAKISLSIEIYETRANTGVIAVGYKLKVDGPPRKRKESIMFSDRNSGLVTYQPDQSELDFEVVSTPKKDGPGSVTHLKP